MPNILDRFRRVRRGRPCPVCGHTDWCLVELGADESPVAAVCPRVPSDRKWGEAGYIHVLQPGALSSQGYISLRRSLKTPAHVEQRCEAARRRAEHGLELARAAADLGIAGDGLRRLGAGIEGAALVFPMRDEQERLVGLRLRYPNGEKRSARGSRSGLFIPEGVSAARSLYVCEGPTDTAAVLGVGLEAVGLPSAGAGAQLLTGWLRARRTAAVVVVADNDAVGARSASCMALTLRLVTKDVRVIQPPPGIKDVRAWIGTGARAAELTAAASSAPMIGLAFGEVGE